MVGKISHHPCDYHLQSPPQQSSNTSPKKPSPLGTGTPRASPFRRPESPSTSTLRPSSPSNRSPSNSTIRGNTTPTSSPSKTPRATSAEQPSPTPSTTSAISAIYSPRNDTTALSLTPAKATQPNSNATTPRASQHSNANTKANDPLARLPPQLLHSMRESFAVLDRDNDGAVTKDDVAEILNQLGLDDSAQSLAPYFPHSGSTNLSSYLNTLAAPLGDLSRPEELREAFAAFDVDDSGQVEVGELREALSSGPLDGGSRMSEREVDKVMEGFSSRRAFGKGNAGDRGDVFRYNDFMAEVQGGGRVEQQAEV